MSSAESLIDIHVHLLPGVDDGPRDIDSSVALIEQGLEDGVGCWVTTPHVLGPFDDRVDRLHQSVFQELVAEVARRRLPAELHLASEIMFGAAADDIKNHRTATFGGNGRYFLLEYPMMQFPTAAEEALFAAQLAGLRPIVAHPERNADLARRPDLRARLAHRGILFQINARSLSREARPEDRSAAEHMIRNGLAHFVASDGHDPVQRPAFLRFAYERVAELTSEATARRLFVENPRAAIQGRAIQAIREEDTLPMRWWHRLVRRKTESSR